MKKLLLASLVAMSTSIAFADNTETKTVTVNGKVIAALGLSANAAGSDAIAMPSLVAPHSGSQTSVTLGCSVSSAGVNTPSASYTGGGSPFVHGDITPTKGIEAGSLNADAAVDGSFDISSSCAHFNLTGETDYNFTIVTNNFQTTTAVDKVELTELNCSAGATKIGAGDVNDIYCGAKVTAGVGGDSATGTYAFAGDLVVTYD